MDKIIINIDPITGMTETSFVGRSLFGRDVMLEVCKALDNMSGAERISTQIDIREG